MYRLKNFVFISVACLFCLSVGVGVKIMNLTRLSELKGERTYFLDSTSSQCLLKTQLTLSEIGRVKGECVQFDLQNYDGGRYATSEEIVRNILERYKAKTLLTEEVDGIVSYYAYTPLWQGGLFLQGVRINLHVAISQTRCVVGTPVIFSGY